MPKIYRVMRKAEDDKPLADASGKGLGVRGTPVNGIADVDLDGERRVVLNGKGMSVAPGWRDLPYHRVPKRLKEKVPKARGSDDTYCFRMGEGPFEDSPLATGLGLKQDSPKHGVVVPTLLVTLEKYQTDLVNTRDDWTIDEV